MVVLLHHRLQLLRRMERHDTARRDRNLLTRLGVSAGTLGFVTQLKVAEAGELDAGPVLERETNLLEEGLHHVLRFALVETDLLKEKIGQLGLRQRHVVPFQRHRSFALNLNFKTSRNRETADSTSASVRVLRVSCNNTLNARLFFPFSTPVPR